MIINTDTNRRVRFKMGRIPQKEDPKRGVVEGMVGKTKTRHTYPTAGEGRR
jgi:hypothetical protein